MTVAPSNDPAEASVELAGLEWQRIQLRIRLWRPGAGGTAAASATDDPSPDELRLVPTGGPATTPPDSGPARAMTPTWAGREPSGELVARFNVMTGPGLRPLEPGTWVLGRADPAAPGGVRPLALAAAADVDPAAARAAFLTDRGEYSVAPRLDRAGRLVLEVGLDPSVELPDDPVRRRGSILRRLVRQARSWLFRRAVRLGRRLTRRTGNRVLFLSHYGTELSGDMQSILARMAERGLDRDLVIDTIRPVRSRSLWEWATLPIAIARADTIVIDAHLPPGTPERELGARIIELWHAGGTIKTIGYSRMGRPEAPGLDAETYRGITWAIVAGEHDVPLFAEAFGIPEDRVIPTGHPRMDRFFDPAWRQAARDAALEQFPEARGRMVILFAPTWRGTHRRRVYDLSILDFAQLHELCVEKDAVFVIRLHPTIEGPVSIPEPYRDRILDGSSTVMDAPGILCATDLLITDYSSIVLEYSILGGPMLFFAPDLAAYAADRDVYLPYESYVPGPIVQTFDALVAAIRAGEFDLARVERFAARHFRHVDQGATDRVIELILGRPPA